MVTMTEGHSVTHIFPQAVCTSPDLVLLEEAARLANAVASDRMGRSYLLQREGSGTIPALIATLKAGAAAGTPTKALAPGTTGAPPDLQRQPTPPQQQRLGSFSRQGSGRPHVSPLRPSSSGADALAAAAAGTPPPAGVGAAGTAAVDTAAAADDEIVGGRDRGNALAGPAISSPDGQSLPPLAAKSPLSKATPEPAPSATAGGGGDAVPASDSRDSVLLQQSLVALQKLSLRRRAQSELIKEGLLPWLVEFLQVCVRTCCAHGASTACLECE